jgi:hypothetical protein
MQYEYVLIENVHPNRKKNIIYSLPDVIKNDSDIRALIDVLDDNNELKLMAFGDLSDESYQKASAEDMWSILDKTAIGMKLLKSYPNIRKFRISSATANRKEDLYKYDVYANRKLTVNRTEVPSFKEYVTNPSKYNPHEVSGGLFKEEAEVVEEKKSLSCWKGYEAKGKKWIKKNGKRKKVNNCVKK